MRAMLDADDRHWWYRGRRRVIRAELARLPRPAPGARVLDAGCGSGRTLQELAPYGEVHGLELNPEAAQLARSRGYGTVVIGRLEQLPWADETFDLITCLDVIEHVADDRPGLRELLRVSRPGARTIITVPAYQALWSAHDEANHHYRRYGRASLRAAATGAGWRVERMTSFNSLLFVPAAAVRLAERRLRSNQKRDDGEHPATLHRLPTWLNLLLEAPMRLEARWLTSGRGLAVGLSLLAVLRKPGAAAPHDPEVRE